MKRLLAIILVGVFFLGSVAFATAGVQEFDITHAVTAVSTVAFSINGNGAVTAKVNKLGDATISNNTLDGWQLTAASANSGQFKNTTTANGEVPINYSLDISEVSGTLGDGMTLVTTAALTGTVDICNVASNQNSATAALKLAFQVDFSEHSTRFDMAGTYADILTITYGDL
jgi:hypothetical protein